MSTTATHNHAPNATTNVIVNSLTALLPGRLDDIADTPTTMSSREIAELTGKEHKHITRDIRAMLEEIGDGPELDHVQILQDSRGYTTEIRLPRDLTHTLVTGYSVPLRLAVVRRLEQLEAEVAKPVFQVPTTFLDAMKLATALEEKRLQLTHQVEVQAVKIEEDKPKIQVFTKLIEAKDLMGFQQFCTELNLNQRELKLWLRDIGWLRKSRWEVNPLPTAKAVDHGYCVVKKEVSDFGVKQKIMFTTKAEAYVELKVPDYIRKSVVTGRKKAA